MKNHKAQFRDSDIKPFKISRTKIELFHQCPRCFYLDRKLGVPRPSGPPFTLNSAVDALLKNEFDLHRASGIPHPLLAKYGIDAKPVPNENLKQWRHNFTGVQHYHPATNFLVYGAIDDLWQDSKGQFIVVDYKSTSKAGEILALDSPWHGAYKRQMEVYQWLLRKNGLLVSDTGYFVYCNGQKDRERFDGSLAFQTTLIPYTGSDGWVELTILQIHKCLSGEEIPAPGEECEFCEYSFKVGAALNGKIEH